MKNDYYFETNKTGSLSLLSTKILDEYAARYRIGIAYQKICYLAMLVDLHYQVGVNLDLISQAFTQVVTVFNKKMPYTGVEVISYQ